MPLTEQEINALLKGVETAGDSCLQFCQFLSDQGVNVGARSTKICHISLQLQKLLALSASHRFQSTTTEESISIQRPELSPLITPCVLRPNDPRIAEVNELSIFQDLQRAVRAGTARREFPVGTVIPDVWTHTTAGIAYLMPYIVVDYREVELSNHTKCPGVFLLRQNALPISSCFDRKTNIFTDSVLRHFLNDDCGGYAAGCSDNLLGVVSEIIIDGDMAARFFPPSLEELHFDPYDNPELEDLVWEYFRDTPTDTDTPCSKRVFCNLEGGDQVCWLRSAYRGNAYFVWGACTDGSATYYYAYTPLACASACVIA